jgi:transcriptional regulator with XRE-family HTH domain
MSQLELGEKTGLTLRTISYYERESDNIPAPVLKKIAEALIVTTNYLIGESSLKIPGDDSPFALRKAFDKLKKLPKKNQKAIIQMIDALDVKNRVAVDNEGR